MESERRSRQGNVTEIKELKYSCWEAAQEIPDDIPIDIGDRIILCFVGFRKDDSSRTIRFLHYAKEGAVYMRGGTTACLKHFTRIGADCTLDRTFYLNCLYELRSGYSRTRWPLWVKPGLQFVAIRHPGETDPWIAVFYPGTKEERRFVVNKPDLDDVIRLGVVPTGFCASRMSGQRVFPQSEYSFPKRKVEPGEKAFSLKENDKKLARKLFPKKADLPEKGLEGREGLSGPAKKILEREPVVDRIKREEMKEQARVDGLRLRGYTDRDINGPHPDDQIPKVCCLLCNMIVPAKLERAHWGSKWCQAAKLALPQEPVKPKKPMGGDSVQVDIDEKEQVWRAARGEF